MLLGTLGANLLGYLSTGKGLIQEIIIKGILRVGSGKEWDF